MADVRLDKFIADSGISTRGEVKKAIKSGKASVNGKIIKGGGFKINPDSDTITYCGKNIGYDKFLYLMLNKPMGVVSATEDKRDKTVLDLIDKQLANRGLFPVGRLDKDTVGLLILTNDGDFAHKTLSPKKHVAKTYEAKITGLLPENAVQLFKDGISIGNYKCKSALLDVIEKNSDITDVKIEISEGKFHQIKRMFEAVGCKVVYLKRISFGEITLDEELKEGEYRPLNQKETEYVNKINGLTDSEQ
jgi:16S rRNA pseudouridine516 synthase